MRQCEQLEWDKRELLRQVVELGERGREEGEEGRRLRGKVRAGAAVPESLAERPGSPLR